MLEVILLAAAVGVLVPLVLLLGPYLPYMLPQRKRRLPAPEANRFAEMLARNLTEGTVRDDS
jgi:hypothetical protein